MQSSGLEKKISLKLNEVKSRILNMTYLFDNCMDASLARKS